ncbi:hypothetical protein FQN54_002045 [Arachnomyces sp. PD_36]|nr:hypothetical protein FQN54_002045 [Arachnomyces sp. PD_36]
MCGIFFSLSTSDFIFPEDETYTLLRNRGPDCIREHTLEVPYQSGGSSDSGSEGGSPEEPSYLFLTFVSTVLDLRGDHIQPQPVVDADSESVLCWNGEAWRIFDEPVRGNDAHRVFQLFLEALNPLPSDEDDEDGPILSKEQTLQQLADVISKISGPYSFVLYDGFHSRVIYGRDSLGRRSLLSGRDQSGAFKISSVCDGTFSNIFDEVDTDGLHVIELAGSFRERGAQSGPKINTIPWESGDSSNGCLLHNPIPPMNKSLPDPTTPPTPLTLSSPSVSSLDHHLRKSLELRVKNIPEPPHYKAQNGAKLAILFSGGLDCTILAKLSHDILPPNEPIDLLNVAFENPRRIAAAEATSDPYSTCPDRLTALRSLSELRATCPTRTWRFISINIPYTETVSHRPEIKRLMRPHNTEMDLSIACALYFAARGTGEISVPSPNTTTTTTTQKYTSTARVLLSGLGADELFAGYQRHTLSFTRRGYEGLISEIDLDVNRLGKRNLGRDDRVISHWGREARFPYLDEDFLSWAVGVPVWEKCGSLTPQPTQGSENGESGEGEGEGEETKKILRLLAQRLGLSGVSREKKRAIQFGSASAKMEVGRGRCNGEDVLVD